MPQEAAWRFMHKQREKLEGREPRFNLNERVVHQKLEKDPFGWDKWVDETPASVDQKPFFCGEDLDQP